MSENINEYLNKGNQHIRYELPDFFLLITYWLVLLEPLSSNWVYQVNQSKIDQDEGEDTLSSLHFLVILWRAHIFYQEAIPLQGLCLCLNNTSKFPKGEVSN